MIDILAGLQRFRRKRRQCLMDKTAKNAERARANYKEEGFRYVNTALRAYMNAGHSREPQNTSVSLALSTCIGVLGELQDTRALPILLELGRQGYQGKSLFEAILKTGDRAGVFNLLTPPKPQDQSDESDVFTVTLLAQLGSEDLSTIRQCIGHLEPRFNP